MNNDLRIYLDHAATTPLCPEALEAMVQCMSSIGGNASGVYQSAREAKRYLEQARADVAAILNARPDEIYFTSSGSESDNWALKGIAFKAGPRSHIITTAIEHPAVLNTCRFLEKCGIEITYLQCDPEGRIDPAEARAAMTGKTALVSVMWANNEIGTIEPVQAIASVAHSAGIPFHSDAVQAVGTLKIDLHETGADLLSLSAHKFYGPKGIGVLYVRHGIAIEPLIHGGEQERGLRASTENVAGAVGLAAALKAAERQREMESARLADLRDRLFSLLKKGLPDIILNGPAEDRLPGNLHISIPGTDDRTLIPLLDLNGVEASAGSACTAGSFVESHVLKAIGVPSELLRSSLRLTLGRCTTDEDIPAAAERIINTVRSMRSIH